VAPPSSNLQIYITNLTGLAPQTARIQAVFQTPLSFFLNILYIYVPYVSKNFWSSRSCKTKALKTYGAACQIITEVSKNVINCRNNFVRKMLSMRMIFTPEQQIFMIGLYFSNGHTLHTFRESDSVQQKCSTQSSY
jgi:hypothetical protein